MSKTAQAPTTPPMMDVVSGPESEFEESPELDSSFVAVGLASVVELASDDGSDVDVGSDVLVELIAVDVESSSRSSPGGFD